ncbi:amino acid/polyamine/organocation transporter (APC superfamily) [Tamaricihabitans halophyticus]|uniref:Amino acid/polyamine/organocation transporter (APC superfamily) n=1 Tax=Tamaricihabitans halophyticus TaxID=1262583 RepID=A0A4R2Q409_9PSEU|nr:APC family permease [Tamaricihabitans halophyticus]TCP42604.1 amino acid/polyamine/organocation transporter (APC superfamily) [Tamaricihabitans halophyticus]
MASESLGSNVEPLSGTNSGRLRRGAIGVPGMVFMVVACTAPLTAMASNLSLSLGIGAGVGTLGWLVVVSVLLAIYTSGYTALSRTVVSAGAYHAYVAHGLGPAFGAAIAFIAGIAYNLACAAMIVATGFYADLALSTHFGIDLHWAVYSAAALVVLGALGHYGVTLASKVTATVCLLQFVLLAVLAGAVFRTNPSGFTFDGFSPGSLTADGFALTAVFCMLSFAGYEAAASYGEECEAPAKRIRRATVIALGLLTLVYLISSWTLIAAYDDVVVAGTENPGALLDGAAAEYLGSSIGVIISVIVTFSFLTASVAFHNMASRYGFALGRAGLLPRALARTHTHRGTPHVATITQIAINVTLIGPFIVTGADPITGLFPAVSGVTSLALIAMTVCCSLSALVASLRGRLPGTVVGTRVAPVVAAAGLAVIGVLIVLNYQQVTGSSSAVVAAMPLLLVVGAAAGVLTSRRHSLDAREALHELRD